MANGKKLGGKAAAGGSAGQPEQPHPLEQTRSFGNEVEVDDNFEQFFKKTVAVIPGAEQEYDEQGEYESVEDVEKSGSQSLFARFMSRTKKPPMEPEQDAAAPEAQRKEEQEQKILQEQQRKAEERRKERERAEAHRAEIEREAMLEVERIAQEKAMRAAAARAEAERQARELAERQAAEKAARERAEREAAERAAREKAARDQAEREAAERAAREKAARERAEKEAAERAERERQERLEEEKAAREKAEHEAAAEAAERLADRLTEERRSRELAERRQKERQYQQQAQQRMEQQQRKNAATAQAAQMAIEQASQQSGESTLENLAKQERRSLGEGDQDTMSIRLELPEETIPDGKTQLEGVGGKKPDKFILPALHLFGRGSAEAAQDREAGKNTEVGDSAASEESVGTEWEPEQQKEPEAASDTQERENRSHGINPGFVSGALPRQDPESPGEMQALLEARRLGCVARTAGTAVIAAILLYLGIAARSGTAPIPDIINPQLAVKPFLAINMLLLLAAAAAGLDMLRNGLAGILGKPVSDTLPALAMIGALAQLTVFLIKPSLYDPIHITVFAASAALLLCLNQAGRLVQAVNACESCGLLLLETEHEAASVCSDRDMTIRLARGLEEEDPVLLLSRPAGRLTNFLRRSFSQNENESRLQHLSWLLLLCAAVTAGISVLVGGDAGSAVSTAAGLLCLGSPLASVLASSLPMNLCSKGAARMGAIVPGWESAEELAESNLLHVSSDDLFPAGCIHLHGIKTFEKERIDLAILYAASIMQYSNCGLRDVFMAILQNDTRMLFKTDGVTKTAGKGIAGWIDNQRIIVGNREMMSRHNIEIPSMDYENHYTRGQRSPVYLAVAGRLFGMFLLNYVSDPTVLSTVEKLRAEGYSLLVSSEDFCVTAENIENAYGFRPEEIRLLDNSEKEYLAPNLAYTEQCDGCLLHLGSIASAAGGIRAAVSAREAARAAATIMTASVMVSCAAGLALAVTDGMAGLVLPAVTAYQAAWCGLTLMAPALKKY